MCRLVANQVVVQFEKERAALPKRPLRSDPSHALLLEIVLLLCSVINMNRVQFESKEGLVGPSP